MRLNCNVVSKSREILDDWAAVEQMCENLFLLISNNTHKPISYIGTHWLTVTLCAMDCISALS